MKPGPAGVFIRLPLLLALLASSGWTYYHFVHYASLDGPYEPIVERFNLDELTDQTVYFFVGNQSLRLAANDTFPGLVSQIRQALAVWDSVPTSALRVAYGGLMDGSLNSQSPGGEILFAELPPGVIGMGGPVTHGDLTGEFLPIVRSQVILSADLTQGYRPQQSFSELFFNSLVHEIGHALGLQHTLASSVMSTDLTRTTTRSQPLGADDIAGLSVLYPNRRFAETYGVIAGRVLTTAAQPVALASVVAISPGGTVVSALTAPDGAYLIQGVLPGNYLVYAHPLPPATQLELGPANIILPTVKDGTSIPASGPFKTVLYGDTRDPEHSAAVAVAAGATTTGIDFRVETSDSLPVYNVATYSFPGNSAPAVHPAFLNMAQETGFVVAVGVGLAENVANLQVEVLGSIAPRPRIRLYEEDPQFVRLDFDLTPLDLLGPKQLIFRHPDDIYVLPNGVSLAAQPAPVIHWLAPALDAQGNIAWSVRASPLDPRSRVYFDGLPATTLNFDPLLGEILVAPPPGPPGHEAVVTVYNPDGQSSAFTLPDGNILFRYPEGPQQSFRISPATAEVGANVVVEVQGSGTQFLPGETVLGFGGSNVVARQVEVSGPDRLRAVVTVQPGAEPGDRLVSVTSGLQIATLAGGFRVVEDLWASSDAQIWYECLRNSATLTPDLSPGVRATLWGRNLNAGEVPLASEVEGEQQSPVSVTLNGIQASLLQVSTDRIDLVIPESVNPGTAELVVFNGLVSSNPMLVRIGRVSPGLFRAYHTNGKAVDADLPTWQTEALLLLATGLGRRSAEEIADPGSFLQILVDGERVKARSIQQISSMPGLWRIGYSMPRQLTLDADGQSISVSLMADGYRSNTIHLPVRR